MQMMKIEVDYWMYIYSNSEKEHQLSSLFIFQILCKTRKKTKMEIKKIFKFPSFVF